MNRIAVAGFTNFLMIIGLVGLANQAWGKPIGEAMPRPTAECPEYVVVNYAYSSEKLAWTQKVLPGFNQSNGKRNKITGVNKCFWINTEPLLDKKAPERALGPMGSGKVMRLAMDPSNDIHLASPASSIFLRKYDGNGSKKVFKETGFLVRSPVVIAMWEDMAHAIGWDKDPNSEGNVVSWQTILNMIKGPDDKSKPQGWASVGAEFAQWGKVLFRQTKPGESNSGTQALYIQALAAKKILAAQGVKFSSDIDDLSLDDMKNPQLLKFLQTVQTASVRYGKSTNFLADDMAKNGKELTHIAVMYENLVIEMRDRFEANHGQKVVAIYPEEGTFESDHPLVIMDGHTDDEKIAGAKLFSKYLQAKEQQVQAVQLGFRPGKANIELVKSARDSQGRPIFDLEIGVIDDPTEWGITYLSPPLPNVIDELTGQVWQFIKKASRTVLLVDTSGSMDTRYTENDNPEKFQNAKDGVHSIVGKLTPKDFVKVIPYNRYVETDWLTEVLATPANKMVIEEKVEKLDADGGTSTYDGIDEAYDYLCGPMPEDVLEQAEKDSRSELEEQQASGSGVFSSLPDLGIGEFVSNFSLFGGSGEAESEPTEEAITPADLDSYEDILKASADSNDYIKSIIVVTDGYDSASSSLNADRAESNPSGQVAPGFPTERLIKKIKYDGSKDCNVFIYTIYYEIDNDDLVKGLDKVVGETGLNEEGTEESIERILNRLIDFAG